MPICVGEQLTQNMKKALLSNLFAAFYNALKKKLLSIAYPFRVITSGLPHIDPGNPFQYTISFFGYPKLLHDKSRVVAFSAFINPAKK